MSKSAIPPVSYAVFAHLNVEKTPLYRAILSFFVAERARFVIALRPSEIQAWRAAPPARSAPCSASSSADRR